MNRPVESLQYLHLEVKQRKICALQNLRSTLPMLLQESLMRMYTACPTEHMLYAGKILLAWLDLECFLLYG